MEGREKRREMEGVERERGRDGWRGERRGKRWMERQAVVAWLLGSRGWGLWSRAEGRAWFQVRRFVGLGARVRGLWFWRCSVSDGGKNTDTDTNRH
jgi:hypothetical protein